MNKILIYPMQNSTIGFLHELRTEILIDPEYQRKGEIWNEYKRQLLVDSIINGFDIPKIYFHEAERRSLPDGNSYAIIDGRQRLEAIWGFIDGKFALSDEFDYIPDRLVRAANLTFRQLGEKYPRLQGKFTSTHLDIIVVRTDAIDLIEDMFSRLNEAVPLNAAEKRNAMGGRMAKVIRAIGSHAFFSQRVKFSDSRYQHREVAARLLFIEYSLEKHKKVVDTKKVLLDSMVKDFKKNKRLDADKYRTYVKAVLDTMKDRFKNNDDLLSSQAAVPIYYLLYKGLLEAGSAQDVNRQHLLKFREVLAENRRVAEKDITKANFDYLEFDRLSQQGTNDASSIRGRLRILKEFLKI